MKNRLIALVVALAAALGPAFANGEGEGDVGRGLGLMDQGTRLLLRGLMAGIEPQLRDLAQEMAPALQDLKGMLGELDAYHAPQMMPNGDIIIRRKVPLIPQPDAEIDL